MSESKPLPLGKAIRRNRSDREDAARVDDAAIEAGAQFWRDHAPEEHKGLIDAEPVDDTAAPSGLRAAFEEDWERADWAYRYLGAPAKIFKRTWEYLKSTRAYRAVASGLELARSAVRSAVEKVAAAGEDEARKLGERLRNAEIDLPAWQLGMEGVIKRAHVGTGLVGAGGRIAATPAEVDAIQDRIRDQFMWLEAFAVEIEEGLTLDGKIPDRCSMYVTAAVGTYERARRVGDLSAGWSWERRILHSVVPCLQCTEYAARGWQEALILPDVGEECECASRCKCTFERSQVDPRPKKGRATMAGRALEYLLSQPLLCTLEAADLAASIANREGDPAIAAARRGAMLDGSRKSIRRDGVAVIPIMGAISRYAGMMEDLCPVTSVESIEADLVRAVENPAIRGIVLDIDSPGGEVNGTAELAGYIRAADAVKPVSAFVGGQGCSAAYWLAASAGEVVCSSTAMLGSIGVVGGMRKKSPKAGEKSWEFVSTDSPLKRLDPETDEGKAEFMKMLDSICSVFIGQISTLRGVSTEKVKTDFGRGGVLIGQAAVDAGMADEVGDFESTLARLSRGERLPREKSRTETKPGKPALVNSSKGTSKMALNPFKVLAAWFEKDPVAATAAMKEESGSEDIGAILAKLQPASVKLESTAPVIDADALRKQVKAELEAEAVAANRTAMATFYGKHAQAFVTAQVKAEKIGPVDGPSIKALYTELALADHVGPLAVAEGQTVDRLSILTKLIDGKTASAWTTEHVATGDDLKGRDVLPTNAGGDTTKVNADRVLSMLSATPQGRQILADRAAVGK